MSNPREIISKVKSLKTNSDSMAMKKNKGTVTGSLIGMGVGALYGLVRNYNLISSAFLGAVLGGLAAHLLLPNLGTDEGEE